MKRFHVHLSVKNLEESIVFYSGMFGQEPNVRKEDYAKWMLEDPKINLAISRRSQKPGLDHLGIQVESEEELAGVNERLMGASLPVATQAGADCCYSQSDKHWTVDPQGIAWEAFHTLSEIPVFGKEDSHVTEKSACCVPDLLVNPGIRPGNP
ncbi:MAG: ArsI/CadI family heavy metal resistance metalloenzyme [Leptospirales bacterium]